MPRLIPPELGNGKRPSDPRYGPGSVVVLDVSDDTHALVGAVHDAALDPDDDTTLLTGTVVLFDNSRPVDSDHGGTSHIHIGASTLHEAATEAIYCVSAIARDMPTWVASTDEDLAAVIAEHFTVEDYSTCEVIDMSDVPA